jgi:glycosyltransferase involved in cell wall biosynthesis
MNDAPVPTRARRRRLLLLLPFPPSLQATHGGGRAMAHLVAALATRHDVAVLYSRGAGEPPMDAALRALCARVVEVERDGGPSLGARARHRGRVVAARLRGMPAWPAYWSAGRIAGEAHRLAAEWKPEVVHLEYQVMGQFAGALDGCYAPRILTCYEAGTAMADDDAGAARRLVGRLAAYRWRSFERSVMAGVDAVVVFTERDRDALAALAGATAVRVIPLAVELPPTALDPLGGTPPEVLFVGNFDHPPNVDAARRLARRIAPRVLAAHPRARVVIVGPNPPAELRAAASESVIVTGAVPDVTPHMNRAAVVVAPIHTGGGMRLKVLEALACGKAVVATPRALEGLDVANGEQVMVAGSDEAMAEAIVMLLGDPAARGALGGRARDWARATFGYERWAADYDRLYAELDRGRAR